MGLYLYGASGHGKVVAEIAEAMGLTVTGFIDGDEEKKHLLDYKVFHAMPGHPLDVVVTIGNNTIRQRISTANEQVSYPVLIHPKTFISQRAVINEGTVIMAGVSVNSETTVGKHCILNTNASVDHDCTIGDFVHISPNAALAGNVEVGEGTHIGIGSCVIQGIKIGKWCTVGAGSVVIRNIPDGATVVGNPAKIIKIKEEGHF